jgi:hypothetical protein
MTGCALAVLAGGTALYVAGGDDRAGVAALFAAAFFGAIGWTVDYLRDEDS